MAPHLGPGLLSVLFPWGVPWCLSTGEGTWAWQNLDEGSAVSQGLPVTKAALPLLTLLPPASPRPSRTTSSLQTTTRARSPTGTQGPLHSCRPAPCTCHQPPPTSLLSAPHSSANKCLLKVAGYAAQLEQYQKAVDIYEQVGPWAPSPALCRGRCSLSYVPVPLPPSATFSTPLPPFLSTSLCHSLTLPLLTWLNISSTRGPTCAAPFP